MHLKLSQKAIPEETPSLMQREEEQIDEREPGTPQSPPPTYTDPSAKKPTGPQNPPPPPPPPEDDEDDVNEEITKNAQTRGSKRLERQEGLDSGKECE